MIRLTELHTRRKSDTGKWGYYFTVVYENGKRKQVSHYVYKKKREARQAGEIAYKEFKRKSELKISDITFSELVDLWMNSYCSHKLAESTKSSYAKRLKNDILPVLKDMKIEDIKTNDIDNLVNNMINQKRSRNSINNTIALISGIFTYANKNFRYDYNPASNATKINSQLAKRKNLTKHPNVNIEREDIDKIFKRFTMSNPQQFLPLLFGYRCGLRRGEIFAITWDEIDFDKKTLKVKRQVKDYNKDGIPWKFDITKYDEEREISLDNDTIKILKEYRKEHLKNRESNKFQKYYVDEYGFFTYDSSKPEYDFVIRKSNSAYATRNTVQQIAHIIHHELNIPNFTMHSLRCTHATDLSTNGIPLKEIMERLGHKKPIETLGYTRTSNKSHEILESKINELYDNNN